MRPKVCSTPLRDAGVDTEGVDTKLGMTTTNELVYAADGTKQLKFLKQAGSVIPADIPDAYLQAAVFHAGPLDYEVPLKTVQALARLGGQVSLDLGGYGGAHVRRDTYERKKLSRSSLEELIACAQVAKASDEDARLLFGDENLSEQQAPSAWSIGAQELGSSRWGRAAVWFSPRRQSMPCPPFPVMPWISPAEATPIWEDFSPSICARGIPGGRGCSLRPSLCV